MVVDLITCIQKIMNAYNVPVALIHEEDDLSNLDFGLPNIVLNQESVRKAIFNVAKTCEPDTIYLINDVFKTQYTLCSISEENYEHTYLLIGPFLLYAVAEEDCQSMMNHCNIPQQYFESFMEYYRSLSLISDSGRFFTMTESMLSMFFPQTSHVTTQYISDWQDPIYFSGFNELEKNLAMDENSENPDWMKAEIIAERYAKENEVLEAVLKGDISEVEHTVLKSLQYRIAPRFSDPIRNSRNMLLTFNTLLRKTMERAQIPPLYIDRLSEKFSRKIETVCTNSQRDKLVYQMLRQYCLLVNHHSLSGYSPVIASILQYIDLHLDEKLSQTELAKIHGINPSYLSVLFKQETKKTLTEYVLECRIQKSLLLLNTTKSRICDIAIEVGIPDANYFSKLFKKQIGCTPREYCKQIKNTQDPES